MREKILAYLKDLRQVMDNFSILDLERIVGLVLKAYARGKRIFVMGNGGSAATASHFACDINKGVSSRLSKRFKVVCLNDNIPTLLAYANDSSFEDIFVEQLKNMLEKGDLIIAISTSGSSKNVLKAVKFANASGAITIALTGLEGGDFAKLAKYSLTIRSKDMQKIEDMHLVTLHMLMQILLRKITR